MIPEIDSSRFDQVVEKGKDSRMEMFSGFADVFGNNSSQSGSSKDLSKILKGAGISDVFIVGLAGDYCVKCTALDAKKEGFDVCVVREATKCVDAGYKGWGAATLEMEKAGVNIISIEGSDVGKVASLV